MTWSSRRGSLSRALLAVGLAAATGCGGEVASSAESRAEGAALSGSLSVTVRDEATNAVVSGAVVRARSLSTGTSIAEASTDANGVARLSATELTGAITLEVASTTSTQLFLGIRTDDVTVAMPSPPRASARVTGNARALPAGATSIAIGGATPITLLRTPSLDGAATAPCAPSGDACTFELAGAFEDGSLAAATVADATEAVVGFVVGRIGPTGGTLETNVAAEDFVMTLPSGSGLTGIVGVPGLAEDGALVLLPQTQASPAVLRVPSRVGPLAGASYWVIVEARPMTGVSTFDRDARTVLFARGVTTPADLPAWSSWLVAPTAAIDVDTAVTLDAVPEADVHVIDWIDATGRIRASAWVLDDTLVGVDALRPSGLASSDVARVRVRALDTTIPPTSAGFVAGAMERGVIRFSERTLTR